MTVPQEVIDVDANADTSATWMCTGLLLEFPEGKNHYMLYLFGLHTQYIYPPMEFPFD